MAAVSKFFFTQLIVIALLLLFLCSHLHAFAFVSSSSSHANTTVEIVTLLARNTTYETGSGILGSCACTKSRDELYAYCASFNIAAATSTPVKYNLQPFSLAAKGSTFCCTNSCDLYEPSTGSPLLVCAAGIEDTLSAEISAISLLVYENQDLIGKSTTNMTNPQLGGDWPHVAVDSGTGTAYLSNYMNMAAVAPALIFKIINITSSQPVVAGSIVIRNSGADWLFSGQNPSSLLIIGEFLYVHMKFYYKLLEADRRNRFARVRISSSNFSWDKTLVFPKGVEDNLFPVYSNLANDENFIYDLVANGNLVRCTYNNNNFSVFDFLNLGVSSTFSLVIAPDHTFLLATANSFGLVLINVSTFKVESVNGIHSQYFANESLPITVGKPIILSKNKTIFAFSQSSDLVYSFTVTRGPAAEQKIPVLAQLPHFPLETNSNVTASLQCTMNSDETYAVCASYTNTPIRYWLSPFSVAAVGRNFGSYLWSCDLFETASIETSRIICAKGATTTGLLFHSAVDVSTPVANFMPISFVGNYPRVIVDKKNENAYMSSDFISPLIFKIINIGSFWPLYAGSITLGGELDSMVTALVIDNKNGFLYANCATSPAKMSRISLADFTWNSSIVVADTTPDFYLVGIGQNLVVGEHYVFNLQPSGLLIRCGLDPTQTFAVDKVTSTDGYYSFGISISPDFRYLLIASIGDSTLQMVDIATFELYGKPAFVPQNGGNPIVTSNHTVYAFPLFDDRVFGFSFGCEYFSKEDCEIHLQCSYCHSASRCVNNQSNPYCGCSLGNATSCEESGECFWCGNASVSFRGHGVDLCVDRNNNNNNESSSSSSSSSVQNQLCSCEFLSQEVCKQELVPCTWCGNIGACVEESVYDDALCSSDEHRKRACEDLCDMCSWNVPVALGVSDPKWYCAVNKFKYSCWSPPSCNAINLQGFDTEASCVSSGCQFNYETSTCSNQKDVCFSFFLPGFQMQHWVLMVSGFIKDFVVLILVGQLSDFFMRRIKRKTAWLKFWWNKWDAQKIKKNFDRSIFVNDVKARDETSDKGESFEAYCRRIVEEVFELPSGESEIRNEIIKRKVVDAVAFSMFNSGLWFDLDEDGYSKILENEEKTDDVGDIPNEEREEEETEGKTETHQNEEQLLERPKSMLTPESLESTIQLQREVDSAILARATCVLFYASSRDRQTRVAASLNSFPSSTQLGYYLTMIILFLMVTFYTIFINKRNRDIISQVTRFRCEGQTTDSNATSNSTQTYLGISQEITTYFLLGFSLVNSSVLATVMLISVKTIRALYARTGDHFSELRLPQRLPIMGFVTSRLAQVLLSLYIFVVLVFAAAGATYGIRITASGITFLSAVVLLALNFCLLRLIRWYSESREKQRKDNLNTETETQQSELGTEETNSAVGGPGAEVPSSIAQSDLDDEEGGAKNAAARNYYEVNRGYGSTAVSQLEENEKNHRHRRQQEQQPGAQKTGSLLHSQGNLSSTLLQKHGQSLLSASSKNSGPEECDFAEKAEILEAKKNSVVDAAPVPLRQALLVFLVSEEIPTIILTLSLQLMYNFMCLIEYQQAFGIAGDPHEMLTLEFDPSRRWNCLFEKALSREAVWVANVMTSFIGFF